MQEHARFCDAIETTALRLRIRVSVLCIVLLAGCSSEAATRAGDASEHVIPAGAVHVVGTSEAIAHIMDVATDDDGTIWILNTAEPFLIAMAQDGSVTRSWGRRGGGPAEFRNPGALVPDAATGKLWLYDRGRHALLRIDGPEEELETVPIPRDAFPSGRVATAENFGTGNPRVWVRSAGAGFVFAVSRDGASPFERLWNTDLVVVTRSGEWRDSWAMSAALGDPASRYGSGTTQFMPYPLWTLCADGSMAQYDPLGNRIRRASADGAPTDSIALPGERRVEITMDRIFRMAYAFMRDQAPAGQRPDSATMYANLAGQWSALQAASSPVFPEYAEFHCSGDGALWLMLFDADAGMMGRSLDWYRIDAAGRITGYRFPDGFRPLQFEADRILGLQRDELDIESAAWLELPSAS
jgi:hypothetical protein